MPQKRSQFSKSLSLIDKKNSELEETIYYNLVCESRKSKVYHVFCPDRELAVKILYKVAPSNRETTQFYKEFELTKDISHPCIRKPFDKCFIGDKHAVFLEWEDGITLEKCGKIRSQIVFLKLAWDVVDALAAMHAESVIHKGISTDHILVNTKTRSAKLIGFGLSSKMDAKAHHLGNPEHLDGNLYYISPEQTGRMNRTVDFRTDFYSLGIVFYYMMSGKLPFQSEDALEMVHMHMAQSAQPLSHLDPDIPAPLSDMVAKLMEKNAEDRYQSAKGLLHDIESMLSEVQSKGKIFSFELAQKDFSGRFQLQQKLYGREIELARLMSAFDRVSVGGSELVLISGLSGTGKTALVYEVHKPITEKKGFFISGKFDQLQRGDPYSAFVKALDEFCIYLLTENQQKLNYFRTLIRNAVGSEGKILTDAIPKLEMIIGKQEDIPELTGIEAQFRFVNAFCRLVKAISAQNHPLVIFIDDWQWGDTASLHLFLCVLTDKKIKHLLVVGAFRNNEVSETHPLFSTLSEMRARTVAIQDIEIKNLGMWDVNEMIADAIKPAAGDTYSLMNLVYHKTHGNAFFVHQFLKSLSDDKLIFFSPEMRCWLWNVDEISMKNITDNVVEFMAMKLLRLPEKTLNALKIASCLGNSFELSTLKLVGSEDVENALEPALFEKLITESLTVDYKFYFAHDRIQQAVYSLLDENDRVALHYRIGKKLISSVSTDINQNDEKLFLIVNQLNFSIDMEKNPKSQVHLAFLNLKAGEKAQLSGAFASALGYVKTGIQVLKLIPDYWEKEYDLSLQLHLSLAKIDFATGNFSDMEQLVNEVVANSRTAMDKIKALSIQMSMLKCQNKHEKCIEVGFDALKILDITIPASATPQTVVQEMQALRPILASKSHSEILSLPIVKNERINAEMEAMSVLITSAFRVRPNLLPLISFRMVLKTLESGLTEFSNVGITLFALFLCSMPGGAEEAYTYGQLGLQLGGRTKSKKTLPLTSIGFYFFISPWSKHIHSSLDPLSFACQQAYEIGSMEEGGMLANFYCIGSFLGGKSLRRLEEEMRLHSHKMKENGISVSHNLNEIYRQAVLNFLGEGTSHPALLKGDAIQEVWSNIKNSSHMTQTFVLHFVETMLAYFFYEYEIGTKCADEARLVLNAARSRYDLANFVFYDGLLSLQCAREAEEKYEWEKRANESMAKIKEWCKYCPDNFSNKLYLLEAELAYLHGNHLDAAKFYYSSLSQAGENEFMHEEALAFERAGIFYLSMNLSSMANRLLSSACKVYSEWGAKAKVNHLKKEYPGLSFASKADPDDDSSRASTFIFDSASLDKYSIEKASNCLKSSTNRTELMRNLTNVLLETAGAQKCLLLLYDNESGELNIVAKSSVFDNNDVSEKLHIEGSNELACTVAQYVKNTHECVLVNDAQLDIRFSRDSYIQQNKCKSILCAPIINYGKFVGEMYLENNLAPGVFTEDRLELLTLLSCQIVISLDD